MAPDKFKNLFINFWPPFFFTGIRVVQKSPDLRHITVKLKLRFWNKNYVGTQYGGSIYSMADAFYMLMLINNLGRDYIVWDKGATIRFMKPGKTDLIAEFDISQEDLEEIKAEVEAKDKMDWHRKVEIRDKEGVVVAEVDKIVYIKKK